MRTILCVLIFIGVFGKAIASDEDIFEAAKTGDVKRIQSLIGSGSSVNATKSSGETPLDVAIFQNKTDVVKVLLARGANPNFDLQGITPLQEAIFRDTEIVRALIDAGADVNRASDNNKYSPLGLAALYRQDDYQRYQIEGSYSGPLPDCIETVRLLIKAGANVNHLDRFSESPLRSAMRVNNLEIAKLLLDAKADVHQRIDNDHGSDQRGDTILMATVSSYLVYKDLSAIKLLLEHGANPNDRNELPYDAHVESNGAFWRGHSVLTFAAENDLLPVVKLLLEYGANDGSTALDFALERKHFKIARLLKNFKGAKSGKS